MKHRPRLPSFPFALAFAVSLSSAGCSKFSDGDLFYVRHKGADMPVFVTGAEDSDTFVVLLHGGPGASALLYHLTEPFLALEEDYRLVYWDQRAAGGAQGNPSPNTLTVAQAVEDLDVVLGAVRSRYPEARFVLLGHSWGGALGSAYLTDPDRQAGVEGWIEMDGAHDLGTSFPLSKAWALDAIEQQRKGASSRKRRKLKEAEDWYRERDDIDESDIGPHTDYIHDLGGYYFRQSSEDTIDDLMPKVLLSPVSPLGMDQLALMGPMRVLDLELSPQMNKIVIPSLVLWGAHDGILPLEQGRVAYESLGTDAADKELVVFEESAHSPFIEEPELFLDKVRGFLDGLD